jgi:chromosome segregation protein
LKIKDSENKNKTLKENEKNLIIQIKNLENSNISVENQMKNLKENFELEIKEKRKIEDKNKYLINSISLLTSKIFELYEQHSRYYKFDKKFYENINSFISSASVSGLDNKNSSNSMSISISNTQNLNTLAANENLISKV